MKLIPYKARALELDSISFIVSGPTMIPNGLNQRFDESSEEFVVQGRKGPSTWVGKYLAEKFPSERVHLSWLSIDWERGSVIYCRIDGELQVEVK